MRQKTMTGRLLFSMVRLTGHKHTNQKTPRWEFVGWCAIVHEVGTIIRADMMGMA